MTASTLVVASLALLVVLAFVGSDAHERLLDAQDASSLNLTGGWLNELDRYYSLTFALPARAASVVLMVLAVMAFLLRSTRPRRRVFDLSTSALGVGLLLLALLPDKLYWHFGALLGLGACAVALETARIREEQWGSRGWHARPFVIVSVGLVTAIWIWSTPLNPWSVGDLATLDWTRAFERLRLGSLIVLSPFVLMLVATGWAIFRRDPEPSRIPWKVASWTALMVSVPVLSFTAGVLLNPEVILPPVIGLMP